MLPVSEELTSDDYKTLQEDDYRSSVTRELRDFMRNGDQVILRRALFKIFVHHPTPIMFKQHKANAALLLMFHHADLSPRVSIRNERPR